MLSYFFSLIFLSLVCIATLLVAYSGILFFVGFAFKKRQTPLDRNESDPLPLISIIVPAKNEAKALPKLLGELSCQDYSSYEVIVSEDGSTDSTRKIASEWSSSLPNIFKLVSSDKSSGKPAALNRALEISRGSVIGVIDADSSVDSTLLRKVAGAFSRKDVEGIQGETSILNKKTSLLSKLTSFEHEVWNRFLLRGRARLRLFVPCIGNLSFVRRSVLEQVGGWYPGALAEDVELSLKMWKQGHILEYRPEVSCKQTTVSKIKSFFTQRTRWYGGYVQSLFWHGDLMAKPSVRSIDAELLLMGPLTGVIGIAILGMGLFAFVAGINTGQIIAWSPYTVGAYTAFSSIASLAAVKYQGERHAWKLIPAVYLYWALESFIALYAFVKIISRRRFRWVRTEK
jgi:cellulose synthase/poly-beta-1,6-N-acetylglucosamine synthase-like glycosyltransferase